MKRGWSLGCVVLSACGSTPEATSERTASTANATSAASASSTAGAANCDDALKAVKAEAAKITDCKTDSDCTIHSIPLCGEPELGCYGVAVNSASSTTALDAAIATYSKSCPTKKCKCAKPEKSVCTAGKCSAG